MTDITRPRVTAVDQQAAEAVIKLIDGADWDIDDKVAAKCIVTAMHTEREAAEQAMSLLEGIAKRDHTELKHQGTFKSCVKPFCKYRHNTIAAYREATKEDNEQ